MNLLYLVPRFIRHFVPDRVTRFLLLRNWIIRAGYETNDPQYAIQRYLDALEDHSFEGKRVMVFGYGGRFDIGVGLMEAGAGHVILCDKYARPDESHNRTLLDRFPSYLCLERNEAQSKDIIRPKPGLLTLLEADIRTVTPAQFAPVDVVISNSVYEHLDDVEGVTKSLASLTKPDGVHVHFIDLRDHYFKYPFEMLKFSAKIWYGWLNPTSNHNRFRLWDYRKVFENYFDKVNILVLERDEPRFLQARAEIFPEFISGNLEEDSVTLARVVAQSPPACL